MAYRSHPQYRSWNALALGIKTEETVENPDKVDDSWSKDSWRKPRRESWSQPTQRGGRGTRGRGVWFIDNRPQTIRRRNTMPNSSLYFQNQDQNYNYRTNDRSDDYNQHEVNPIWEESSRNLSTSPNKFMAKEDDSGKYDDQNFQDETSSWNRDSSFADNAYRSPKSRSTSYLKEHWKTNSNNDDGIQSQSRGYLNGYPKESKGYEPDDWERESTNNKPDQAWVHDKYEGSIGSDSDSRDRKDASTQVTQLDINNQFPEKINTGESTKRVNKSDSPKVQNKSERQIIINSELPKEITIKFSDLTLKDSNKSINKSDNEWSESMVSQTPIQEELPSMSPEVTSEVISEMTSEVISEVTSEVTSEVVTPKEEVLPILINLEEVDNSSLKEKKEPKISQDILSLDWFSYQKALIEEELKLTMERQAIQTSRPYKLDTGLKDFDTLI